MREDMDWERRQLELANWRPQDYANDENNLFDKKERFRMVKEEAERRIEQRKEELTEKMKRTEELLKEKREKQEREKTLRRE